MARKPGTTAVEGQYVEFQAAVIKQLPRDIDGTLMQGWITNQQALRDVLRNALLPPEEVPKEPTAEPEIVFEVTGEIDYAEPWSARRAAMGIADKNISAAFNSEQFPIIGTGKKNVVYKGVRMNRYACAHDVGAAFQKFGAKCPGPEHCMDLAKRHPDTQRRFSLVFLIAPLVDVLGYFFVPVLCCDFQGCWLVDPCVDYEWAGDYVFVGVCEE